MTKDCKVCGKTFAPRTSTAVYCSDVCRAKVGKARAIVALVKPPTRTADLDDGPVTVATLEALGDLVNSPVGQTTVALARRIDAGTDNSGAAVAALSKQHAAQLAMLNASRPAEASYLDKLRASRDAKRNAG